MQWLPRRCYKNNGDIKFKNLRKSGLHSFKLKQDDELVSVALAIPPSILVKTILLNLQKTKNPDRGISYQLDTLVEIDGPVEIDPDNQIQIS